MCDVCEDWDAREPREPGMRPGIAQRAREIERGMPGDPAPDAAWRIALGEDSGAILWADQLRIVTAIQAAQAEPAGPFARRRRGGRFACAAAV